MRYDYDILVIGSGSGGLTCAIGLAAAGKKVALVEREKIGGDCTNYGCIPSKALLHVAKSKKHTLVTGLEEMRKRRQAFQDEETIEHIEKHGIKMISGFASFQDTHTVLIDQHQKITAEHIILSTGSHAGAFEIPGVASDDILTNRTVFELTEDIKNLVVIGGGYIGCELGEAFTDLGVHVTIVQRSDCLIPREEPEASQLLHEVFTEKGMDILLKSTVAIFSIHRP